MPNEDRITEPIPSEQDDEQGSLYTYEILTYPADFTLEVLVNKFKDGLISVPEEQRNFVWTQAQSSKLIESFLMGLPVPPIYLYQAKDDPKQQIVDGLQRLMSIVFFFSGLFGEKTAGRKVPVFGLLGLHEKSPYLNRTYEWLEQNDEVAFEKLKNSVLRSFVMKQLQPDDNTSIFQVFERLNSGGVILQGQEIRNCIYRGDFNNLLKELNGHATWRSILGKKAPDKRMRDMELILRFFAIRYEVSHYVKPMKGFLNRFMSARQKLTDSKRTEFADLFRRTSNAVVVYLGEKPFHIHRGLNAAVFDSVFTAFARRIDEVFPSQLPPAAEFDAGVERVKANYARLLADDDYVKWTTASTTDEDVVPKRIDKAETVLFGQ
jgi:Protein of unknown function DUF262